MGTPGFHRGAGTDILSMSAGLVGDLPQVAEGADRIVRTARRGCRFALKVSEPAWPHDLGLVVFRREGCGAQG